jgi:hypothetical protein
MRPFTTEEMTEHRVVYLTSGEPFDNGDLLDIVMTHVNRQDPSGTVTTNPENPKPYGETEMTTTGIANPHGETYTDNIGIVNPPGETHTDNHAVGPSRKRRHHETMSPLDDMKMGSITRPHKDSRHR